MPLPSAVSDKIQLTATKNSNIFSRKQDACRCLSPSCEETLSCSENKTGSSTLTSLILPAVLKYPWHTSLQRQRGQHLFSHHLLLARALLTSDRHGNGEMQSIHSSRQFKFYQIKYLAFKLFVTIHWSGKETFRPLSPFPSFQVLGVTELDQFMSHHKMAMASRVPKSAMSPAASPSFSLLSTFSMKCLC